jgi:hypothetical protein
LSDAFGDSMFALAVNDAGQAVGFINSDECHLNEVPPATDHDANWRDCLRL